MESKRPRKVSDPDGESEVSPGRNSAWVSRTRVRGPPGDAGSEPLWSFHRWVASDLGKTEACAMLPALREDDSIASQSQDSPKTPKRHFPGSSRGGVCQ